MSRPMAQVTCPQCQTRQEIDPDAEGYRCIVCAGTWSFVRCTVCGERFHTRPGTRAWTCPNCGTPHGRNRRGISRVGIPLPILLGGLAVLGLLVFFLVRSLGSDDGGPTTPSSPSSASPITDPANKVCGDLGAVQVLRVDALGDAADALTADADALRAAGEAERADLVDDLVAAVTTYQEVAEGGGDTQAATNQLLDALAAVDWCD
jgi:ssDNA-binding Zn-finger/Zn-ribbon topoisomerase 1